VRFELGDQLPGLELGSDPHRALQQAAIYAERQHHLGLGLDFPGERDGGRTGLPLDDDGTHRPHLGRRRLVLTPAGEDPLARRSAQGSADLQVRIRRI
jgi:hypothetical protein